MAPESLDWITTFLVLQQGVLAGTILWLSTKLSIGTWKKRRREEGCWRRSSSGCRSWSRFWRQRRRRLKMKISNKRYTQYIAIVLIVLIYLYCKLVKSIVLLVLLIKTSKYYCNVLFDNYAFCSLPPEKSLPFTLLDSPSPLKLSHDVRHD